MTLVELIIAIVIINVGLMGVMLTFITVVRTSVNPMIYKQMAAVADGMMEEILLKPFYAGGTAHGGGCARDTFDEVGDYAGYHTDNVCTVQGDAIAALAGYTVDVALLTTANTAMPGVPTGELFKITIRVQRGDEFYVLSGWRTCYGGTSCN